MGTLVQFTAEYSNAVLVAVLPYISTFAERLALPVDFPVTRSHVLRVGGFKFKEHLNGMITLTNGYKFWLSQGYVDSFDSPRNYFTEQDPDAISKYFGEPRLAEKQALQMARDAVRKLGYASQELFIDQKPKRKSGGSLKGNKIPYFRFEWHDEKSLAHVCVDVDAARKQIVGLKIFSKRLSRSPPKISVEPLPIRKSSLGSNAQIRVNAPAKRPE